MNILATHKFSPERYLANREYFDSGLISCLEKQQQQLEKHKQKESIYKATITKKQGIIKTLHFQLRQQKDFTKVLQKQLKDTEKDSKEKINEVIKEIEDIKKTVNDELQITYQDNTRLHEENMRLRKELEKLKREQKTNHKMNSTNSNMPTSTDGFLVRPNLRTPSTKKKGGQVGHTAHRSRCTTKKVDEIRERYVKEAPRGAEAVYDENREIAYYRTQEVDMVITTNIIETRYYIKEDGEELKEKEKKQYQINSVTYAPHFIALTLYLNHKGNIAMERLSQMLREMSGGEIVVRASTISQWTKRFHKQSEAERKEIVEKIVQNEIVHVDETGWKVNGKNAWLHVMNTKEYAYFVATKKRGDKENGPLALLREYLNILIHDHFISYTKLGCQHGECNAHILRHLKAGFEWYEDVHCAKMIQLLQTMLHKKKEAQKIGIQKFSEEEIKGYEETFVQIAEEAVDVYNKANPGIAKRYIPDYIKTLRRMSEKKEDYLLFIRNFNVPFDNNAAERQMRIVKGKKKISGQSTSIETANYFASILTIMQTCKLQDKNTLEKIEDILRN